MNCWKKRERATELLGNSKLVQATQTTCCAHTPLASCTHCIAQKRGRCSTNVAVVRATIDDLPLVIFHSHHLIPLIYFRRRHRSQKIKHSSR